jgi:hypothetical protein
MAANPGPTAFRRRPNSTGPGCSRPWCGRCAMQVRVTLAPRHLEDTGPLLVDAASCWSQVFSRRGVCQILAVVPLELDMAVPKVSVTQTGPARAGSRPPGPRTRRPSRARRDRPGHPGARAPLRARQRTFHRRPETGRAGAVEPGERQCHGVGRQRSQRPMPDGRGLGHPWTKTAVTPPILCEERSHGSLNVSQAAFRRRRSPCREDERRPEPPRP